MVGLERDRKLATLSDGTVFEPVNSFKTNQTKLARLQRQLSKKVKFSSNWKKQKPRSSACISYRQYPPRLPSQGHNDYQQNHAMIVIEDLKKVASMSKSGSRHDQSARAQRPGKIRLNRSIQIRLV